MTSVAPAIFDNDFQGESPSATDKVMSASVDSQFDATKAKINELLIALSIAIRDDNTLTDQIVRLRNLHPEISALIASKAGWQPKVAVATATTANLVLSGEQTIDGVLTSASRVLVKNQTLPAQNGIYLTAAGAWSRVTDADTSAELGYAFVYVTNGTLQGATTWVLTQAVADIVAVGTTSLTWAQVGGTVGPIPINKGGTGATTAAGARLNIGITAAMDALVTAITAAAGRNALGATAGVWPETAGGTGVADTDLISVLSTSSTYPRTLSARFSESVNVKDFGAIGDGVTDDTAAFQAAVNQSVAGISAQIIVSIPQGKYLISSTISIVGRNVVFKGNGYNASQIIPAVALAGALFSFDGTGGTVKFQGMLDLSIVNIAQTFSTTEYIKITAMDSGGVFKMQDCHIFGQTINAIINCLACSFLNISRTNIDCYGYRIFRCGGGLSTVVGFNLHDCVWRRQRVGYSNDTIGSSVLIGGTCVSSNMSDVNIGGGGQENIANVSGITSTVTTWTVNTSTAHLFNIGDRVLLQGMTPTAYNGVFEVATIGVNTLTISDTTNPGVSTVNGTIGYPMACLHIDNSLGPVNEGRWSNLLLEAVTVGTNNDFGSVSVLITGFIGNREISNHIFSNIWCDYGQSGIIICGKQLSVGVFSCRDLLFSNVTIQAARIALEIVSGYGCKFNNVTSQFISGTTSFPNRVAALFIANSVTPACVGLSFANCDFGPGHNLYSQATSFLFGISHGGGAFTPERLIMSGCSIYGATTSVKPGLLGVANNARISGCMVNDSGNPLTASSIAVLATAATIVLPFHDVVNLTGVTTVNTMNGGWIGRRVELFTTGIVTFTGGNIANATTTAAGQLVVAIFDGTSWHLR